MKKIYFLTAFVLLFIFFASNLVSGESETTPSFVAKLGKDFGFKNSEDLRIGGPTPNNFNSVDNQIMINSNDYFLEYKYRNENREFKNLAKGSSFTFKNGELIESKFNVEGKLSDDKKTYTFCDKDGCKLSQSYKIGNREYDLVHGSKVYYKKGEDGKPDIVKITIPNKGDIPKPKKIDNNINDNAEITFEFSDDNSVKLNNNEIKKFDFNGKKKVIELGYDTKKETFFMKGAIKLDGLEVGVYDSGYKKEKTYLYFAGDKISSDEPYIFLDEKKIQIFSPKDKESPSVRFLKGNKYFPIENEFFVVEAIGRGIYDGKQFTDERSLITINHEKKDELPKIKTEGSYNIYSGDTLIKYNSLLKNGPRMIPKYNILKIDDKEFNIPEKSFATYKLNSFNHDGSFIKINRNGNDIDAEFTMFMDYNGDLKIAQNNKEKELFSKVKFSKLSLEEQNKLKNFIKEGGSIEKIFSDENTRVNIDEELQKIKIKREEEAKKREKEDKKNNVDRVINGFADKISRHLISLNLPQSKISKDVVKELDIQLNSDQNREHKTMSRLSSKSNSNDVIAVILSMPEKDCIHCKTLANKATNQNGLVYKINYEGNPGAVLGFVSVDQRVQDRIKKSIGINKEQINKAVGSEEYPKTFFIHTPTGRIIGIEFGSGVNFNKYFNIK